MIEKGRKREKRAKEREKASPQCKVYTPSEWRLQDFPYLRLNSRIEFSAICMRVYGCTKRLKTRITIRSVCSKLFFKFHGVNSTQHFTISMNLTFWNQVKANISIVLGWRPKRNIAPQISRVSILPEFHFCAVEPRRNKRGSRRKEMPKRTKEIPVICPTRYFRVVDMSTTTPILSSTKRGQERSQVGRWRCREEEGLPTATQREITFPQSAPQTFLRPVFSPCCAVLRFSHMHPSAAATVGIRGQHAGAASKKRHLSFSSFFCSLDRDLTI